MNLVKEFESGDLLRVTELDSGRSYVANYIRGDSDTITVNSDPYNERGERTYKRSGVTIDILSPIADADKVIF